MKLAIITALKQEISGITGVIPPIRVENYPALRFDKHCFYLLQCGVGVSSNVETIEESLQELKVERVINSGFVGSLKPELQRGEIVLVKEVVSREKSPRKLWYPTIHCEKVVCYTSAVPLTGNELHLGKGIIPNAEVVDMELYPLTLLCEEIGIPIASFKIISDHCEENALEMIRKSSQELSKLLATFFFRYLDQFIASWKQP